MQLEFLVLELEGITLDLPGLVALLDSGSRSVYRVGWSVWTMTAQVPVYLR